MKVEVDILDSPSLTVLKVSVDSASVPQQLNLNTPRGFGTIVDPYFLLPCVYSLSVWGGAPSVHSADSSKEARAGRGNE